MEKSEIYRLANLAGGLNYNVTDTKETIFFTFTGKELEAFADMILENYAGKWPSDK